MPKSKKDYLKRSTAQAMNHLQAAIVDLSFVLNPMSEAHSEEGEELRRIMQGIMACHQHLVKKSLDWWGLDEERIQSYI